MPNFYDFQFEYDKNNHISDLDVLRWIVKKSIPYLTNEQIEVIAELAYHKNNDILKFSSLIEIYALIMDIYYNIEDRK